MSNAEPTCQDGFSNFKIIFLKIQKLLISHYKNVKKVTNFLYIFSIVIESSRPV